MRDKGRVLNTAESEGRPVGLALRKLLMASTTAISMEALKNESLMGVVSR